MLVLLKFEVNSQKLGVKASMNFEYEWAIAMLKCENLLQTNSRISGAQLTFSETSTPQLCQGCARFAEISSELTKTWISGATEF